MKYIKLFTILLFVAFSASSMFAQVDKDLDEAGNVIGDPSGADQSEYVDDIVKRTLITENRVMAYEPIREADIAWEKRIWRVIDTREKLNMSFRYPLKPFFSIMQEIVDSFEIDMVDIFRASSQIGTIVDDVINLQKIKTISVVWMQIGVRDDCLAKRLESCGLTVIMDRCPKIEYRES